MNFGQLGVYLQDEWNIRDNFKLTAGIRMDNLSFLNDLMRNQAIYDLDFNGMHIDTGAWPDNKLQFSPRLGFTWDVFNDKSLKVRGGSGFFTGRIPLVFFTNMPTNSGMIQNLVSITTRYKDGKVTSRDPRLDLLKGGMITDVNQMISTLGLPTTITPEEGVLPSGIVGIDPDFKMPQVWKTSLALDYQIPVSFPLSITLEGMFSKDINAVRQYNYNIKSPEDTWQRFNGPDDRYIYPETYLEHTNINSANVLTNTSKGWGWTGNITVFAEPAKNLNIMAAYTHTESKEISGMPGSDANSAWTNMPSINGPNNSGLMRSRYVTPDRVIASINWRVHVNKRNTSNFSLFYSGYSAGGYSFMYTNDMNGDGVTNDLMYIPKAKDEIKFTSPEDADAFWKFVNQDPYLKKHKGEYAEAYAARAPWVHRFDFRWSRDFSVKIGRTQNTLQLSLDILNVGNLLNSKWGVNKNMSVANGGRILTYAGRDENNTPVFSMYKNSNKEYPTESFTRNLNYSECWKLQIGLRYIFN